MLNEKTTKRTQQRFRFDRHNISTEEINKTAIWPNDDKRVRSHDKTTTYQYGSPMLDHQKSDNAN